MLQDVSLKSHLDLPAIYRGLDYAVTRKKGGEYDDSLKLYEEGVRLIRQCHEKLTGARRRIEIIAGTNENGKPVLRQMDEEERSLEERSQTHGR